MCRVLGVSRSGYYAWRRRPLTKRGADDARLGEAVATIHQESRGTYGSPRIHRKLQAQGERISRRRVARLMTERALSGRVRRRFVTTTQSEHAFPVAPNTLNRNFYPSAPNKVWAGDITYIQTLAGWAYLAVVIDLYSRRVVGWALGSRMTTDLVLSALGQALAHRDVAPGLIFHSDQGSQYAANAYRETLEGQGLEASMSRKGNCWDNAVVESFFGTIKQELIHGRRWRGISELRIAVHEYIEVFYNRKRSHSTIGFVAPATFEEKIG